MAQIPFVGPSYALRSVTADCQRTVNLYPDINELQQGKVNVFLMGTPGLKEFITPNGTAETDAIRALFVDSKDNFFIVCGFNFIQIIYDAQKNDYIQRVLGNLNTNSGPVDIAENGFQIAIVDGDNYYLYIYEDDTFRQYKPDGWFGSNIVTYFGTYFVFVKPNSQQFYISNPYDGKIIDPLMFASKEGSPDNLVTTLAINQTLWLFGKKSIEIYYNSGAADFPLSVMDGGFIQYGCVAPFSVALANNAPIWLGRDENGAGTVYMANASYQPVRISNFAVEFSIQNIETIEDAVAYTYQQEGHYFYVINFPSAGTTWVYDVITQMWHERQFFNSKIGQHERHRSQYHVYWNKKHLVSDYAKNIVYDMSLDYYDDNGDAIHRMRRSPHQFGANLERLAFREFQLDLDVGTPYDLNYNSINGNEPQIRLRYSSDAGKTWSDYLQVGLGYPGNYKKRVIWRRLGMARDRVWEVSQSDPIKTVWLSGNAIIEGGLS